MDNTIFSQNLKELRKERNISQSDLAKSIGVSQGTIYFWENNINEPTAGYILKLANYFNVTTDELLGAEKINKLVIGDQKALGSYNKLNTKNKKLATKIIEDIYQSQKLDF